MPEFVPEKQRRFAVEVVEKLRAAGFQAYWAGGCVRDQLMGRTPKDYDVATDAEPPQIRRVFDRRRTIAVGAAFGVITVLGPEEAGQVEVATFRRDAAYSDGRHPDSVSFSTAREDAARRDFTINGLFYDPIDQQVIDLVAGQEDLARGVLRAVGDPRERIGEDKLRMLRAVRFSASLEFKLEANTLAAIREMAPQVSVVSAERIAMEIERMLVDRGRTTAVRLLLETGLAAVVLPEIVPVDPAGQRRFDDTLGVMDRLGEPSFPLALAALLYPVVDPAGAKRVCRRWRLSNFDTGRTCWLVRRHAALDHARTVPWSKVQRLLVAEGVDDLLTLSEARAPSGGTGEIDWCRARMAELGEELDPPLLLTGDDLIRHGIPVGPAYRELLRQVRDAQLDNEIHTKADALALVDRLVKEGRGVRDEG
jgi:poly(A) polymerase